MKYALLLIAGLSISACGEKSSKSEIPSEPVQEIENISSNTPVVVGNTISILLKSDDNMQFDQTELRVKEGQLVKLTLQHTGTLPKTAMGHNFVLLKAGTDLSEFGTAAASATAPEYKIPAEILKNVVASTDMIGGGEKISVEFTAPAKGTYQFLCSYPGHYGMMKGNFIVE